MYNKVDWKTCFTVSNCVSHYLNCFCNGLKNDEYFCGLSFYILWLWEFLFHQNLVLFVVVNRYWEIYLLWNCALCWIVVAMRWIFSFLSQFTFHSTESCVSSVVHVNALWICVNAMWISNMAAIVLVLVHMVTCTCICEWRHLYLVVFCREHWCFGEFWRRS